MKQMSLEQQESAAELRDAGIPQTAIAVQQPTTMQLIQQVLAAGGNAVEMATVVKELVALRQSEERFKWEREERQAKIDFDNALNECQEKIGRITPNVNRQDTKSWWADYMQLDKTVRPVYAARGFSIAFSETDPIAAGKVRIKASLSRGGISKEYFREITPSMTGPKGGAMATATDADAIAGSRAKRYLLLDIFNIAVGIDKEEKKGSALSDPEFTEHEENIKNAATDEELKRVYQAALNAAKNDGDSAVAFEKAKNARFNQLHPRTK